MVKLKPTAQTILKKLSNKNHIVEDSKLQSLKNFVEFWQGPEENNQMLKWKP